MTGTRPEATSPSLAAKTVWASVAWAAEGRGEETPSDCVADGSRAETETPGTGNGTRLEGRPGPGA